MTSRVNSFDCQLYSRWQGLPVLLGEFVCPVPERMIVFRYIVKLTTLPTPRCVISITMLGSRIDCRTTLDYSMDHNHESVGFWAHVSFPNNPQHEIPFRYHNCLVPTYDVTGIDKG